MPEHGRSGGWLWIAAGLLFFGGCVSQADYDLLVSRNETLLKALKSAEERIVDLEKALAESREQKPGKTG